MIRNILGRIFAAWAILLFVITLLIVFPPLLALAFWKEPRRSNIMHSILRGWMEVFFFVTGLRLKIRGIENFKKGENYIVVFNHRSLMDPPVSTPFMPGGNKTIAKAEMAKTPVFGIIYRRGSVLVDRKNEDSRRTSYMHMKEVVEMGLHMVIYPEGTRNKTKEPLTRFHDGAFRLAMDTGKPVMPALLFNTDKVLPWNRKFFFWPAKIFLDYLPAVDPSGFSSVEELKKHVFDIMFRHYVAVKPQRK
jgi:1-acyl-sn-glycerol-3-phosphate acyltransferase